MLLFDGGIDRRIGKINESRKWIGNFRRVGWEWYLKYFAKFPVQTAFSLHTVKNHALITQVETRTPFTPLALTRNAFLRASFSMKSSYFTRECDDEPHFPDESNKAAQSCRIIYFRESPATTSSASHLFVKLFMLDNMMIKNK